MIQEKSDIILCDQMQNMDSKRKSNNNGVSKTQNVLRLNRLNDFSDYKNTRESIRLRKNALVEAIEQYSEKIVDVLNQHWSKINEVSVTDERNIQRDRDSYIFPTPKLPTLKHCNVSEDAIAELFGGLSINQTTNFSFSKESCVFSQMKYVNPLRPVNAVACLAGCALDDEIALIDVSGDPCKQLVPFKGSVCEVVPRRNGDILLTTNSTEITTVSPDGNERVYLDFEPLIPKGFCVTPDGDCFVGLREKTLKPFTVNRCSERQIRHIDKYGRTRRIFEFDEKNNRLFTVPSRVCADISKVYVLDSISSESGRIVTLDLNGRLCWIYQGYSYSVNQFCPNDLVVAPNGFLILSDTYNHAIHFLSLEGDTLLYNVLTNQGISFPCGLGFDFTGKLWVGTYGDKERSKIHILSIFEAEQKHQ